MVIGGNMIFVYFLIGFGILLLLYMAKEAFANRLLYHTLFFPEFPESFEQVTIFFISDIHRRNVSDKIITKAVGKADIVIIGGDLTEKGVSFNKVKTNILKLKRIAPVFFVWGNNDYEVEPHLLDTILLDCGVKVLANTAVKFESNSGDLFNLLGIDDLAEERDRLDYALQDAEKNGFRVLVSHNPEIIHKIKPENNIHLVLSGHTHGGQIRIFGYGPYEKGGIKKIGNITVFISNGYGTTALPLRLGAKAETHLITIKNQENRQY